MFRIVGDFNLAALTAHFERLPTAFRFEALCAYCREHAADPAPVPFLEQSCKLYRNRRRTCEE